MSITDGEDETCPTESLLRALVRGRLSKLAASPLTRHLDICIACQSTVAEIARNLTLSGAPDPQPHECGRGEVLAVKYRLETLVGAGGAGIVWQAARTDGTGSVAIKLIRRTEDQLVARLRREARLLNLVSHVSLVSLLEIVECDTTGAPGLVMPLLRGEDLSRRLLGSRRFSCAETARLLLPVMDAVATMHDQAIAHRDLKPANIFVERGPQGERSKVLDLGLARCLNPNLSFMERLTATGVAVGTPRYMAPEQLAGSREVGIEADVWALAIIWREVSTGSPPEDLPPEISALMAQALAPRAKDRPTMQTMHQLVAQAFGQSEYERG